MTPQFAHVLVASLLVLAVLLSTWRRRRHARSGGRWSFIALPLLALLLYALLFPPVLPVRDDRLIVLTDGATAMGRHSIWPSLERIVALPEALSGATVASDIERVPDLATALRRHPQTRRIAVIGTGLVLRDQDAAHGLGLTFDSSAEHGLVELSAPDEVAQGTAWTLVGRATLPGVRVELRDPSGATVDGTAPGADGRFRLSAVAPMAGSARYELRLLDKVQGVVDTASVPVVIRAGEPLSAIVRSGAPDPEFKYWRRWAADAGISVQASAGLSEGLKSADGQTRFTPAALAATDFVIVDERAWTTLGADEKQALRAAVDEGLGLLLRADGPVTPDVAAEWSALGFRTRNDDAPHGVTIDRTSGLHERDLFTAAPVETEAGGDTATTLLTSDDDEPLVSWRAEGKGRVVLWRLVDSYRLILRGEPARYGSLWQRTLAVLTRARAMVARPRFPEPGWTGERSVLCGLADPATVHSPDGGDTSLLIDDRGCAAYWPTSGGWQQLRTGAGQYPFYVRDPEDGRGLHAADQRSATSRLVRDIAPDVLVPTRSVPLPRWPFFVAWLLVAGLLWWRERAG